MKEFKLNGVTVVFWHFGTALFCKIAEMGADVYCCGVCDMPTTDEEALALTEKAWL